MRRINDFISFDPAFCPTLEDEVITANILAPLLRYKKRARDTDPWGVENHLVASWVSSGGRDYGFELRGTENWKKDGGAIASEDVAFSFDRLLSGENLPNHSFVRNLDKVTVNDPRKCEVLLRSSAVEFPMTFAARGLASVLPKKTVSANGDFGLRPPDDSGSYTIAELNRGANIVWREASPGPATDPLSTRLNSSSSLMRRWRAANAIAAR